MLRLRKLSALPTQPRQHSSPAHLKHHHHELPHILKPAATLVPRDELLVCGFVLDSLTRHECRCSTFGAARSSIKYLRLAGAQFV